MQWICIKKKSSQIHDCRDNTQFTPKESANGSWKVSGFIFRARTVYHQSKAKTCELLLSSEHFVINIGFNSLLRNFFFSIRLNHFDRIQSHQQYNGFKVKPDCHIFNTKYKNKKNYEFLSVLVSPHKIDTIEFRWEDRKKTEKSDWQNQCIHQFNLNIYLYEELNRIESKIKRDIRFCSHWSWSTVEAVQNKMAYNNRWERISILFSKMLKCIQCIPMACVCPALF